MSYSGDPSASDKDYIRFITGDVKGDNCEILNDVEIEYLVLDSASLNKTLISAMEIMLPRVASEVNQTVGDVIVDYSDWYKALKDAYNKLTMRKMKFAGVFVGGASKSQSQKIICDTDRVIPFFEHEPTTKVYPENNRYL